MLRAFLIVFAALALFAPAAAAQNPAEVVVPSEKGVPPDIVMQVDGLTCPFCSFGLEKKLLALDATEAVEIKLSEGVVHIALKPAEALTDDELRKAVKDAGFTAGQIERPKTPAGAEARTRGQKMR